MSLHYSNGKLLLKNLSTSSTWYFIDLTIIEGVPFIRLVTPGETFIGDPYSTYAVLAGPVDSGDYYKYSLSTVDGDLHAGFELLGPAQPPDRIILLADDGNNYELTLVALDTEPFIEIVAVGLNIASIESPWPTLVTVAEDTSLRRSLVPVLPLGKTIIVVPI